MALHLLTYADDTFRANADGLVESAIRANFSSAQRLGPTDLYETTFFKDNKDILKEKRGVGYWAWKPYIILEQLSKIRHEDCILYCDSGRINYYRFKCYPTNLEKTMRENGQGFLLGPTIPHHGPIKQWTKRDCLLLMEADAPSILESPPILATWSLWTRSNKAISFLEEWLAACTDRRCLTDDPNVCGKPNHDGFKDHRHDQSIMSILAYKLDAPFLDFSGTLVHRLIERRPYSGLGAYFYKRPQNVDDLLASDNPCLLVREFFRLRMAR